MHAEFRAVPVAKNGLPAEYPRDGCPDCKGPVECEVVTCNYDHEHEVWECQNDACGADELREDDLVWVKSADEYPTEPVLDPAAELKAGRVMPSLVPWVKARVQP